MRLGLWDGVHQRVERILWQRQNKENKLVSLVCLYTNARTRTNTHMHPYPHTHKNTPTHKQPHNHTSTHARTRTCAHKHTCADTHIRVHNGLMCFMCLFITLNWATTERNAKVEADGCASLPRGDAATYMPPCGLEGPAAEREKKKWKKMRQINGIILILCTKLTSFLLTQRLKAGKVGSHEQEKKTKGEQLLHPLLKGFC